ncbi:HNH endonuclease [Arthrobacter phage RadFad]|nr:HNH endonuclease [Arthrobacter phage RadFad]
MKTFEQRFWEKVEKTEGCWNWTAAKNSGYGRFQIGNKKLVQAHRVAYELTNGPIAPGLFIDHMCHNRACVNPAHLRTVTNKEDLENREGAQKTSRSGIRGVYWNKAKGAYYAQVQHAGKRYFAGMHSTLEKAEAAAVAKRNELFTHNLADRTA